MLISVIRAETEGTKIRRSEKVFIAKTPSKLSVFTFTERDARLSNEVSPLIFFDPYVAPSKRRIPRILIEDRALEVGIKMYLEDRWMVFEESQLLAENLNPKDGIQCKYYFRKYHLLPASIDGTDTYEWLKNPSNALLLWGNETHYFVKPVTK